MNEMLCPTCHRPYSPPIIVTVAHDDSEYRARRRADAAETVASYRAIADSRDAEGRHAAAVVWRQEAAKLEAECARIWGA
jgi:hypothetical protein